MRVATMGLMAAVAVLCTGCASPGGPPMDLDDDRDDGPPGPAQQLFISPAGKPFRAEPGEAYPVATWFVQADLDRDGRLIRDEFRADAAVWFKALDVNSDGRIDMPETTRWEEELVPETTRSGAGRALAQRGRRFQPLGRNELDTHSQGAAPYSLINEPHPIRGADADLSYSVSVEEFRAAADRRFGVLDVDGDGAIRLIDLKPTAAQAGTARAR